ncbi:MAG: hypothetical protein EBX68_04485, partial [Betaproteobacteria bacterium]|nr:hypothetical protein [Betaproteobacteria bacterium]
MSQSASLLALESVAEASSPSHSLSLLRASICKRSSASAHCRKKPLHRGSDSLKKKCSELFSSGICPRCRAADQYGDSCEACGATYSPTELIDPRSVVSGATPIRKTSDHFFFKPFTTSNLSHQQACVIDFHTYPS